jgi:cytidylate kinase
VRVQRIMSQQDLSLEAAEELVKQTDRVRLGFVEEFYRVPWNSMQSFDLVINTGKVDPTVASEMIVDAARKFRSSLAADTRRVASIEVDRLLADSVSEVLGCRKVHA